MLPTLLAGLEASQAQTDTFIQFYKAHSVGLYRYALSWVKNPHQAEDIAQTAWLQCVQHAQRFFSLPEEKRLPWMVRRDCSSSYTSRSRRRLLSLSSTL